MGIDQNILVAAYSNYRKMTNQPFNGNTRVNFLKFIKIGGYDFRSLVSMLDDNLSEETTIRLQWLAGPNHEFMFKVWKARNGYDIRSKAGASSVASVGKGDGEG